MDNFDYYFNATFWAFGFGGIMGLFFASLIIGHVLKMVLDG